MKKRILKKIYSKYIEDIAIDISTDCKFRQALFESQFDACDLVYCLIPLAPHGTRKNFYSWNRFFLTYIMRYDIKYG